jgi:nitrite reductase/ring-hydroxylating ferredoxin subunit
VSHGYRRILLCREGEHLFALEDLCPHAYQSLAGGEVRDGVIRCPRHGACFNLSNGLPTNTVSKQPVKVFAVRIRQGRIEVDLG